MEKPIKAWNRYYLASEKTIELEKLLFDVREELENITVDNADEIIARSEELLREYTDAINEIIISEYAGNYINVIDRYSMFSQVNMMINILKCIVDPKYTRQQVMSMAIDFLDKLKKS